MCFNLKRLVVHVDIAALGGGDGRAWLHGGPAIAPEVARRLACDTTTRTLLHDARGSVIDLGRRRRTVTPALRLVLELRDGGCAFPGCGRAHHLAAHHIVRWADGGPTDRSNLVLLCSHHHTLVHEHGWTVAVIDHRARFARPERTPVAPAPAACAGTADQLVALSVGAVPDIDHRTIEPRWRGEHLDVGLAIDALLSAEAHHRAGAARRMAAADETTAEGELVLVA